LCLGTLCGRADLPPNYPELGYSGFDSGRVESSICGVFAASETPRRTPLGSPRSASSSAAAPLARVEHDDLVGVAEVIAQFQGAGQAGEARAQDDDAACTPVRGG
jgi:hypothetical protein